MIGISIQRQMQCKYGILYAKTTLLIEWEIFEFQSKKFEFINVLGLLLNSASHFPNCLENRESGRTVNTSNNKGCVRINCVWEDE